MYSIGIDIGSVGTKAVLFNGEIVDSIIIPTGWSPKNAGKEVLETLINRNNITKEDIKKIVVTGYGRVSCDFADKVVTEITCHAKGANFLNPNVRTILDIGGQDSKAIRVSEIGMVEEFLMNDRCAAGTGRFIQVMSNLLEVDVSEFDGLANEAKPQTISSMCTVFAESEVVSLLAGGATKGSIARGIMESIANRSVSMMDRVGIDGEVVFTGGVSRNETLRDIISKRINCEVKTYENSQLAGALGAAIIGLK